MHTHTLAEWAAFTSLGISAWAAAAAVIWLTADAEVADFDPRPALRITSELAKVSARKAAVSLAALLMLLTPATPEGAR